MLVEKDLLFIRLASTEADVVVLYFSFIFNGQHWSFWIQKVQRNNRGIDINSLGYWNGALSFV